METIGFVGLGVMGKAMAANLVKAGYPVIVHNRSREAVDELACAGAEPASSPREAAERSDVVITMLPDSPDVEAVVLGQDGVAEGAGEGMLLVEMSTIAPAISRRLHETLGQRGVDAIDAPVSGGQAGAQSGELSIMVGGSDQSVKRAWPILEVLGGAVTHIGPPGAGQVAKAANQIVVALTIQAVSEALTLTRKAGSTRPRSGRHCWVALPRARSSRCTERACSRATSSPASGSPCTARIWRSPCRPRARRTCRCRPPPKPPR